jgi:hypothetical protein
VLELARATTGTTVLDDLHARLVVRAEPLPEGALARALDAESDARRALP